MNCSENTFYTHRHPVENNLDELYNLITLLKPGQLKRQESSQLFVRAW